MPALPAGYQVSNTTSYDQEAEATQCGHMTTARKDADAESKHRTNPAHFFLSPCRIPWSLGANL